MLALPTHLVELRMGGGDGLPHPLPFPLLVRLRFLVFAFAFVFDSVGATVSIGQVGQSCLSRRGNTLWHSQVNAIWEYEWVSICVCVSSHTFRCCGMWNDDKSFARKTRELSWGLERQSRKGKSSQAGRAKQKDWGCCRGRASVGWGWGCWVTVCSHCYSHIWQRHCRQNDECESRMLNVNTNGRAMA